MQKLHWKATFHDFPVMSANDMEIKRLSERYLHAHTAEENFIFSSNGTKCHWHYEHMPVHCFIFRAGLAENHLKTCKELGMLAAYTFPRG